MKHLRNFQIFEKLQDKVFVDSGVNDFQKKFPFPNTNVSATRFEIRFENPVSEYMVETTDKKYWRYNKPTEMKIIFDEYEGEGFYFLSENDYEIRNAIFSTPSVQKMINWCYVWKISRQHYEHDFPESVEHIIKRKEVDLNELDSLLKDHLLENLKEDSNMYKLKDGSYNLDFLGEFGISSNELTAIKYGI